MQHKYDQSTTSANHIAPAPAPEMAIAFDRVSAAIQEAEGAMQALASRLSPVMRPTPPSAPHAAEAEDGLQSPMANTVHGYARRLETLRQDVSALIGNLAI
jgi:hypothetical protein